MTCAINASRRAVARRRTLKVASDQIECVNQVIADLVAALQLLPNDARVLQQLEKAQVRHLAYHFGLKSAMLLPWELVTRLQLSYEIVLYPQYRKQQPCVLGVVSHVVILFVEHPPLPHDFLCREYHTLSKQGSC